MLRERALSHRVQILSYCVTSNHVHLLVSAPTLNTEIISVFMQSLAGDFAQTYNLRKKRHGAFWNDRYHATMIDGGEHLWRCLKYIDLNMVRAGVTRHPKDWPWTGYQELMGLRHRYRVLDMRRLLDLLGGYSLETFRKNYGASIAEAIAQRGLSRQGKWTESVAVGSEGFIKEVGALIRNRMQIQMEADPTQPDSWVAREVPPAYS